MHPLIFLCPSTNRPIRSGLVMDAQSFGRIRQLSIPLRCTHCGVHHTFRIEECVVDDDIWPALPIGPDIAESNAA